MNSTAHVTIGLDVSDRYTHGCVLSASGAGVEQFRVRTTPAALRQRLGEFTSARVIIEAGTHSPWMSRVLSALGCEVIGAHPSKVNLIARGDRKSDRSDAQQLARLGRIDPDLLSPVSHRSEDAQKDLMLLRVRDGLVRARTQLISQARGLAKVLGARLPRCSARGFARRMNEVRSAGRHVSRLRASRESRRKAHLAHSRSRSQN